MNYTREKKEVSSSKALKPIVCKSYRHVPWHALTFCLYFPLKVNFWAIILSVIRMQENHNNHPKVEESGEKILCREIKFLKFNCSIKYVCDRGSSDSWHLPKTYSLWSSIPVTTCHQVFFIFTLARTSYLTIAHFLCKLHLLTFKVI